MMGKIVRKNHLRKNNGENHRNSWSSENAKLMCISFKAPSYKQTLVIFQPAHLAQKHFLGDCATVLQQKNRWQLSQAAACDGLVYSVDYNGQNSGTQANALPLFED